MEINEGQDLLSETEGLQINEASQVHLSELSKWTKFISLFVFIACGLFLLVMLFGYSEIARQLSNTPSLNNIFGGDGGELLFAVVLVLILVGGLFYLLFNFSVKIKAFLTSQDHTELNSGLGSLRLYFIITGVLGMITLLSSIYTITKYIF